MKKFLVICGIAVVIMLILPVLQKNEGVKTKPGNDQSQPTASYGKDAVYKVYDHKAKKVIKLKAVDYIIGVVAAEIPAVYEEEAIKAQAVAAHTNVINSIFNPPIQSLADGATVTTNPDTDQAYMTISRMKSVYGKNFDTYYKKLKSCVEAVIGKMVVYEDKPITAAFHAMSSGVTEDAVNVWGEAVPYLVPVDSKQEKTLPNMAATVSYTTEELESILKQKFEGITLSAARKNWIKVKERTPSGNVVTVSVGDRTVTGVQLRLALALRSANFNVSYKSGEFTITSQGYGHGVGLSQNGANLLAQKGKNYKQILTHYYKGANVVDIH